MKVANISRIVASALCFMTLALLPSAAAILPGIQKAEIIKFNNPEAKSPLGVGLWGIPIPIDYDGDGLKDLVLVCSDTPYKGTYFFKNIGSAQKPFFAKAVKLNNLALLKGKDTKNIHYSEYGGRFHICLPGVELLDYSSFGLLGMVELKYEGERLTDSFKKCRSNMWNIVDWDNDGDLDIVVGVDTWDDYGWDSAYDSKGNWTNGPLHGYVHLLENRGGAFVNVGRIQADGKEIDTYGAPNPNIADFDGDGDLDIICGDFLDGVTWFENIGTREAPVFAKGRDILDPNGRRIQVHCEMIIPVATDFDGDGFTDLLLSDEDGTIFFARNTGKVKNHMPVFETAEHFMQEADDVKFGVLCTPVSYDWDGDGLEDMIMGNSAGDICFLKNLGGGSNPVWAEPKFCKAGGKPIHIQAGLNGSIQGPAERKWGYTVLDVADWDGDGRADLIINSIFGKIEWFRNLGAADGVSFAPAQPIKVAWEGKAPKPAWNWWDPKPGTLTTQWRTSPVVIDWNLDGILDIVMLDHEGYLAFFEGYKAGKTHMLKPGVRIFYGTNCSLYSNREGVVDPNPGLLRLNDQPAGQSGRRKICFTDWDMDGKPDLIVDGKFGAVVFLQQKPKDGNYYFKFAGSISSTRLEGHTTCPTAVDWDKNGVHDIVVGAEDGHLYLIKNPLSVTPDEVVKLYPDRKLESHEIMDSRGYFSNITDPELQVYLPKDGVKKSSVAVLVVPGGSYSKNCITYEGYTTVKLLNEMGIAAFILKYRLPNGNPDVTLEDGEAAMRIIRENAERYNINPSRVGVIGFSAGGHFASTLITQYSCDATRPDFGILVYPVLSGEYGNASTHANLLGDKAGTADAEKWNSINNVRPDMPPTMIIACCDDKLVPVEQSKKFYEKMIEEGVHAQIHLYPVGGHGFWGRDRFLYGRQVYPMMVNWIKMKNK